MALSPFIGVLRMNVVMTLVLGCTAAGFALSGVPFLTDQVELGVWGELGRIGGYFLLAAAIFAFYGGSATAVNTAWRRAIFPLGGEI